MADDPPPHDNENGRLPDWLSETEARIVEAALRLAPGLGWTERMLEQACLEAGVVRRQQRLVLPNGLRDLSALLWTRHDAKALEVLSQVDAGALKVRERIRAAVEARVETAAADGEAETIAAAWFGRPLNAPLALRLAWSTADQLWRWAGDVATDENHYSKRAILAGILVSVAQPRNQHGREAAQRLLQHRIDQVMAFEKWKANLPRFSEGAHDLAGLLGKLRYGAHEKLREHHERQRGAEPPPPGA